MRHKYNTVHHMKCVRKINKYVATVVYMTNNMNNLPSGTGQINYVSRCITSYNYL